MSATLRLPSTGRCTGSCSARKPAAANQLLKQLARFNPNQLSSYHGVKLMLPAKGRPTLVPQGSAAARKPVQMSFLGVGAPEAILVAVVALIVFGPKGLADAARSVGSSLRAFQPTIKEVVQVSQELKGSLEKELGLDELREAARPTMRSLSELDQGLSPIRSDTMAKTMDADIEAKRAASAEMAWGGSASSSAAEASASAEALAASVVAAAKPAAAATSAATPLKDIATMSVEELEAELSRRRMVGDKKQ